MRRRHVLAAVAVVLLAVTGSATALALTVRSTGWGAETAEAAATLPFNVAFALVGALILARRPGHPVGWLCAVIGVFFSLDTVAGTYATQQHELGDASSLAVWSAWVASWAWLPAFDSAFLLLPLLYPDGRLPSRRWLPVLVIWLLAPAGQLLTVMFAPGPMRPAGQDLWDNPLGVGALAPVLEGYDTVLEAAFVPFMVLVIVAVGVRFRRAGPVERQQMKWFFFALVVSLGWFLISMAPGFGIVPAGVVELTMLVLPGSIAVAVLRYRLYEIDRIISRTVSYALLTGLLVALYAGAVMLLGRALAPVTQQSEVAVAASTLLVAALFQPVRGRVQGIVDRRFNRARYDAQRTVADFATRLRDEVHLADLHRELLAAVGSSVAPAHASVWLREPGAAR